MQVSEAFFKAKKDKDLRALVIASHMENNVKRTYMYLCINEKSKYDRDKYNFIQIETDTEIQIDNYSRHSTSDSSFIEVSKICFHCDVWHTGFSHVLTFLNAIKKDSDVKFRVRAYNGCDYYKEKNLVHHSLFGMIGDNCYFLSDYVGAGNTAAPVNGF